MHNTPDIIRCPWCLKDDLYRDYHDNEWGKPSHDDGHLFEMMILESFQAGLSWYTILRKRENFRRAFDGFKVERVAEYTGSKIEELMQNAGIIRNRLKIQAAVVNARAFIALQSEFGSFSNYIWQFTDFKVVDNGPITMKDIPSKSKESDALSLDLKKRGFKFMGSTVCYANMQSIGIINDHLMDCNCRK